MTTPEYHAFEHTTDVFSAHREPEGWTGHDVINESGFYEPTP